jgi:hypothetical protein
MPISRPKRSDDRRRSKHCLPLPHRNRSQIRRPLSLISNSLQGRAKGPSSRGDPNPAHPAEHRAILPQASTDTHACQRSRAHQANISPARTVRTAQTVTAGSSSKRPGAARPGHRPPPDAGSLTQREMPGACGYRRLCRTGEISRVWGFKSPPRTHIYAPDLRLFVSLYVNVDKTAAHSYGGSNPSRTHAYIHEPGPAAGPGRRHRP